jgi:hypothetical protein
VIWLNWSRTSSAAAMNSPSVAGLESPEDGATGFGSAEGGATAVEFAVGGATAGFSG